MEGEAKRPDQAHGGDPAFHQLAAIFLDQARSPKSIDEVKSRLGDDYEQLPQRVRDSLESMRGGELAELGQIAVWLKERDLIFDLPGGKVCLL